MSLVFIELWLLLRGIACEGEDACDAENEELNKNCAVQDLPCEMSIIFKKRNLVTDASEKPTGRGIRATFISCKHEILFSQNPLMDFRSKPMSFPRTIGVSSFPRLVPDLLKHCMSC